MALRFAAIGCAIGVSIVGGLAVSTPSTIDFIKRVVRGEPADEGTYPYVVSLQSNGIHYCGGTIVHKNYVITAAHCIRGINLMDFTIKAGTNNLSSPEQVYKVREISIHKNYNRSNLSNDVAILEVEDIDLSLPNISTIRTETEFIEAGETLGIAGWGEMFTFGGPMLPYLRHSLLAATSVEDCQAAYGKSRVRDTQICTLLKVGKNTSRGYSGGPLVRRVKDQEKLVGITSWGRRGKPEVFGRVSSYISWFNEKCDNCLK